MKPYRITGAALGWFTIVAQYWLNIQQDGVLPGTITLFRLFHHAGKYPGGDRLRGTSGSAISGCGVFQPARRAQRDCGLYHRGRHHLLSAAAQGLRPDRVRRCPQPVSALHHAAALRAGLAALRAEAEPALQADRLLADFSDRLRYRHHDARRADRLFTRTRFWMPANSATARSPSTSPC